jgi:hypothetical protein
MRKIGSRHVGGKKNTLKDTKDDKNENFFSINVCGQYKEIWKKNGQGRALLLRREKNAPVVAWERDSEGIICRPNSASYFFITTVPITLQQANAVRLVSN